MYTLYLSYLLHAILTFKRKRNAGSQKRQNLVDSLIEIDLWKKSRPRDNNSFIIIKILGN